jgi:predicted porin
MKKAMKLCGPLAGVMLYAFAATALAQDASDPNAAKKKAEKDKEAAAAGVPDWDSFGTSQGETLEETFFRLSRDFATTSEGGIRRLGSVPIWPRGDLKIAGIRFLPYLREGAEWERNYYKQRNTGEGNLGRGRRSEWTHTNEVGLFGTTALMGGRLNIATYIDSIWNLHYGQDAPPDEWDFNGQFGATYRLPSGAWVAGGVRYQRRHDPVDLPLDVIGPRGHRFPAAEERRDFGRVNRGGFFNFGFDRDIFFGSKLRWEFGVQIENSQATDEEVFGTLNRTETTYYGKASYPFLRDTTRVFVLVRDRVENRDSERTNDGNTWGVSFGIEGSIPLAEGEYRSLRGQVSVGFDHSTYDDETFTIEDQELRPDGRSNATNANFQATVQYIMSPRSTIDLRYLHQTQFSFRGNFQVVDNVQLSFSHNFSRQLTGRIDAFYEHTDPSGRNRPEVVSINGRSGPGSGVPAANAAQGGLASAHNVNREGVGVGLRYAFNEWMDVDWSVDWENRNDHARNSYRNYRGVLGFTFYLNALTPRSRVAVER